MVTARAAGSSSARSRSLSSIFMRGVGRDGSKALGDDPALLDALIAIAPHIATSAGNFLFELLGCAALNPDHVLGAVSSGDLQRGIADLLVARGHALGATSVLGALGNLQVRHLCALRLGGRTPGTRGATALLLAALGLFSR